MNDNTNPKNESSSTPFGTGNTPPSPLSGAVNNPATAQNKPLFVTEEESTSLPSSSFGTPTPPVTQKSTLPPAPTPPSSIHEDTPPSPVTPSPVTPPPSSGSILPPVMEPPQKKNKTTLIAGIIAAVVIIAAVPLGIFAVRNLQNANQPAINNEQSTTTPALQCSGIKIYKYPYSANNVMTKPYDNQLTPGDPIKICLAATGQGSPEVNINNEGWKAAQETNTSGEYCFQYDIPVSATNLSIQGRI